jgi:hypothetical protein
VIGDDAKPYATAIRSFHKRAYLIQQFHTHQWEKVRITEFSPDGPQLVFEDVLEIDYDAFTKITPQIGYTIRKRYKVDTPKKKRGGQKV